MFPVMLSAHADNLFIFGMGYTGTELAKQLREKGWIVCGTCRTPEKQRMLWDKFGLEAHTFDASKGLSDAGCEALNRATHVLSSVPPDPNSLHQDSVLCQHAKDIERCELLRWIGYLSSTGVYGDHQGALVDESSETKPVDVKGVARLNAERMWLELGVSAPVNIFRLGGIYGPGRSILEALAKTKGQLSKQQQMRDSRRFTSRVHVGDVCQVILASIHVRSPPHRRIYNVVDDDPAARRDVVAFAKQLRGIAREEEEAGKKQQAAGGVGAEKRVSNLRIKEELGVQLAYPSYVHGLSSIAKSMQDKNTRAQ